MATTTSYANLYPVTLDFLGGGFKVAGSDLSLGAPVTITEPQGDGVLTFLDFAALSYPDLINPASSFYLGQAGGGLLFFSQGGFFLATNTDIPVGGIASGFNPFVPSPVCFVAGTRISTPEGDRAIETLEVGDLIHTAEGPRAVRFISRTSHLVMVLEADAKLPIRVRAGAFGAAGPKADLLVSPDHALLIEGHLVQASVLVNGSSVVQTRAAEWSEDPFLGYFNIELEDHALITAEGFTVESYVDNVPRSDWDNYAAYLTLYGEEQPIRELPLPRIKFARQLPAFLRKKLQDLGLSASDRQLTAAI
ncbi:MAG: Hint domain-containing protein [Prochlorococcaceae cyanobacterium]